MINSLPLKRKSKRNTSLPLGRDTSERKEGFIRLLETVVWRDVTFNIGVLVSTSYRSLGSLQIYKRDSPEIERMKV